MKSVINSNWANECLMAANNALEVRFRQQASACVALQLARNYRLLAAQDENPLKQTLWRSLYKRWMLSYQLRQQATSMLFFPDDGDE